MSDEIKSALAPGEWAKMMVRTEDSDWERISVAQSGNMVVMGMCQSTGDGDEYMVIDRAAFPQVAALSNAALPADSPYKITREDVDGLLAAAVALEARADKWNMLETGMREALRALAAKLAALLPPE